MAKSPEQLAHEQWLGYIQPEGLVVSIPALLDARAHINQNFLPRHRALLEFLPKDRDGQPIGELPGFLPFAESILGWPQADIAGAPQGPALPDTLQFYLRDYGETLQPKYALRDFNQSDSDWLLLIDELPGVQDFDTALPTVARQWQASPQARFERLLRETKVPVGLLVNQQAIRLVYAPRGESSGFLTFRIPEMTQVAGRPIFAAVDMLLSADRLLVASAHAIYTNHYGIGGLFERLRADAARYSRDSTVLLNYSPATSVVG
jgi:hypothetical protein